MKWKAVYMNHYFQGESSELIRCKRNPHITLFNYNMIQKLVGKYDFGYQKNVLRVERYEQVTMIPIEKYITYRVLVSFD